MFNTRKKLKELEAILKTPFMLEAIARQNEIEEKNKSYQTLVKQPFKYEIIKDFIEAASRGVIVKFTIDGIPIEIRREDKPLAKTTSSALF